MTAVINNAIVRRADFDQLLVEWEADAAADRIEVDPEDGEKITMEEDPGEVRLPLGGLQNGEQRVKVLRENVVELEGGAAGSRMRTSYEVDNRFTLEG